MPVTDIILVPNSSVLPHELMISKNINQFRAQTKTERQERKQD